jgi:hypothetical protein
VRRREDGRFSSGCVQFRQNSYKQAGRNTNKSCAVASKGKARGLGEIFCRWQKLWYSASFWFSRLSEVNRTKESKGFGLRGNHALCVKICMVDGVQDGQREASRTILHLNCTAKWGLRVFGIGDASDEMVLCVFKKQQLLFLLNTAEASGESTRGSGVELLLEQANCDGSMNEPSAERTCRWCLWSQAAWH